MSEAIIRPIAIMSFNRPRYLAAVLDSLLRQDVPDLRDWPIVLFQDGAINARSGRIRAAQAEIDQCVRVFRDRIPWGQVALADGNIGVALNFERAENWVFEMHRVEAGIFLEDDMVLQPNYFRTLSALLDIALKDERVGYVAVYGNHELSAAAQGRSPARYFLLEHNWAFALTRRQWRKNKPFVDQYLSILRGCDYRERPAQQINELYHSWGMGCPGDSQDVTKTIACCLNQSIKLNITACLGRYIGEEGLHMNAELFKKRRYPETEPYTGEVGPLAPVTQEDFDRIFAVQMRWATEHPCIVN